MYAILAVCALISQPENPTTIILGTQVEIVDIDSGGIPVAYATYLGIGVNQDTLNLPLWAQEAMIAHELGHIENGDVYLEAGLPRGMYYELWQTVSPIERDADLFAADMIGIGLTIGLLEYVHDMCQLRGAAECVVEAKLRLEMLQGQYCI